VGSVSVKLQHLSLRFAGYFELDSILAWSHFLIHLLIHRALDWSSELLRRPFCSELVRRG